MHPKSERYSHEWRQQNSDANDWIEAIDEIPEHIVTVS